MATIVMGQEVSLPVRHLAHRCARPYTLDGEVAVALAAAARGIAMGLSSFASKPIEEVIAANPKLFQVYWLGGRDAIAARVERARAAGAASSSPPTGAFPTPGTGAAPRSRKRWTCGPPCGCGRPA